MEALRGGESSPGPGAGRGTPRTAVDCGGVCLVGRGIPAPAGEGSRAEPDGGDLRRGCVL